jgi:competence ComEA-like helix-hairpin-helix protein
MDRAANRTWLWGPSGITGSMTEPYSEAPGGYREVQYFDKTRMEINNPLEDPESIWYVTNGLLAKELITGRVQVGHLSHLDVEPSQSQVAGDRHPDSPTYATLQHLLGEPASSVGAVITAELQIGGDQHVVGENPELASHGVETGYHAPETNHTVAEPFWEFMNSSGPIHENGINVHGSIFADPFFATGFPITEAYWVHVPVAGEWQDVLLQCFERRCLTYTPDNPTGWKVEAGNIGRHYHQFRYGRSAEVVDCIELNLATVSDLVQLTNIGESRAQTIMEHRPFETVDDLERVPGIGPVTVEQIKEQGIACVVYDIDTGNDFHQER